LATSHIFTLLYSIYVLTAEVDYKPKRLAINFKLGSRQIGVTVATIDDNQMERTEYAGVRIVIPPEAQQLGVKLSAKAERIIRIIDNDNEGNVDLDTFAF